MKTIIVPLKDSAYKIVVGNNILSELGARLKSLKIGLDAVIVTNPVIYKNYGKVLVSGLQKCGFTAKVIEVPDGERSKSAKVAFNVIEEIARYDILKRVFIIAFGGGVIGDLAGYVAAAYKRGIPYVQVPTTFLAQIDSAIGGKVAIDLPVGKNLVGAFYQPRLVWSDINVLSTLDKRQIRSGLAEAVKYGIIYDGKLFDYIACNYKKLLEFSPRVATDVVLGCSRIKADVVARDEKETKGIRTILNFGHTVGHAIEAAGGFKGWNHGEAVALGMRVASNISVQLKIFSRKNDLILNNLLSNIGLPEKIKKVKCSDIMSAMKHDKKFFSGKNCFVLPRRIGSVKIVEDTPLPVIRKAIELYL